MIININEALQHINADGSMTAPHTKNYWLGNDIERIAFDFLILDDGKLAVHALYGNANTRKHENFFYGYAGAGGVVDVASSVVMEAQLALAENGVLEQDYSADFINDLSLVAVELMKPNKDLH